MFLLAKIKHVPASAKWGLGTRQTSLLPLRHALFTRIDSASSHLVIALFTPYNLDNHLATRTAIIACSCQTRGGPDSNHDAHVHAGVHASRTTRNNRGGRPWSACG